MDGKKDLRKWGQICEKRNRKINGWMDRSVRSCLKEREVKAVIGREEMKREGANRRVLNSFSHSSRNIRNPEVVFASLCAMIPGGIVKA